MRVILIQQRVSKALDDPENFSDALKAKPNQIEEMNEIAYSSIILHLSDSIVRQVDDAKTTRELWEALDKLFLTPLLILDSLPDSYRDVRNAIKYARDVLTQASDRCFEIKGFRNQKGVYEKC
ncbi:Retrotransposon protein [Abeliophyllum distichum]|uniref:Retrotransposon protein n=1 Tax=Abeliophyllum distichum TaxID=126358 RepID=A0ABD1RFH3_9LAMI